jgi:hypothetical protein
MLLLLLPDVGLEDDCALAIVANIDSVSRLSPITESKTTRMPLLLPLLYVRGPTIIYYMCLVSNKQFKRFMLKFFRILVMVDVLEHELGKVAINPDRFDKLITSLRTAVDNDGVLDKESTSYNDIFDAFRLALKFYHFEDSSKYD